MSKPTLMVLVIIDVFPVSGKSYIDVQVNLFSDGSYQIGQQAKVNLSYYFP